MAMVQRRVPASAAQLHQVRRCVEEAASGFGLGHTERYEFVFAVNEAVTNAIRHGRPFPDGTIVLAIDADGDTLTCSVSDQGRFESPPSTPDKFAEGGRGLAAISHVMDDVQLSTSPDGTTIRLHKRRSRTAERDD
jgi:serine/threonine-protein kinase RsbW